MKPKENRICLNHKKSTSSRKWIFLPEDRTKLCNCSTLSALSSRQSRASFLPSFLSNMGTSQDFMHLCISSTFSLALCSLISKSQTESRTSWIYCQTPGRYGFFRTLKYRVKSMFHDLYCFMYHFLILQDAINYPVGWRKYIHIPWTPPCYSHKL